MPKPSGLRLTAALSALILVPALSLGCQPKPTETVHADAEVEGEGGAEPAEGPAGATRYVLPYGEGQVVAYADAHLEGEVQRLFLLLEDLRAEQVEISTRTRLPIGWTTLSFEAPVAEGPESALGTSTLVVREPDYDGEPEDATRADISVSLATLARQRGVLERVGVAGEAINFDQHVMAIQGALDIEEVLLLRVVSPGGRLTGWRLAPTAGISEEDELESLPVYAILQARPALLDAMLLPSGYMAYYSGDQLTTVLDGEDRVVWDWRAEGSDAAGDGLGAPVAGSGSTEEVAPGTPGRPGSGEGSDSLLPPLTPNE
ncbi:hypothetical protein PPSIR1_11948 [Plesiocystis pacifica SIR-1]|uniref:Imm33-like domain-containing protein n=1 Tax=Plesiocystis pacifica SIR-1 TaxID=391625 RepID=A6GIH6_9BACT|nr:hypothetical protein [Plesiocystis pacifica]EDM74339.1 hypothetical protein PPSIR1_11948 [Plesiocystis pacifica SIR-1]